MSNLPSREFNESVPVLRRIRYVTCVLQKYYFKYFSVYIPALPITLLYTFIPYEEALLQKQLLFFKCLKLSCEFVQNIVSYFLIMALLSFLLIRIFKLN
jgi:hypothetical protein